MDRDPLINETAMSSNDRSVVQMISSVATSSVVTASNSASNTGGLQPIELTEERYILEEDDTSSDSDGSEENDEEREEESNGKRLLAKAIK